MKKLIYAATGLLVALNVMTVGAETRADPPETHAQSYDVKSLGAIGDGSSHPLSERFPTLPAAQAIYPHATSLGDEIDWAVIQGIVNTVSPGIAITLSRGNFTINRAVTVSKPSIRFVGDSRESKIVNTGNGPAFVVTSNFVTFEHLRIDGNGEGGRYGERATGTYGIEFNGASHFKLFDVTLWYHGSHGVYMHGGTWVDSIINCHFAHNGGDGIHSVSPSGQEQNGNNLSIINSVLLSNGGNGLVWNASGLNVAGSDFEVNRSSGILLDTTAGELDASGISIVGNYFEGNRAAQVKFKANYPRSINGVEVGGNYFYSPIEGVGAGTALIVGEGTANNSLDVNIGKNHYAIAGATLTKYIDLADMPMDGSSISGAGHEAYITNMGRAQLIPVFGADNTRDLGDRTHRSRTGYFGTSVVTPSIQNTPSSITYNGAYHVFQINGANSWIIDGRRNLYPDGHNSFDIGLSGTNTVHSIFVGTSIVSPNFNFGVSKPSWTTGTGAPDGGCTTGSLYSRTDGGANTSLYVCERGSWAAK